MFHVRSSYCAGRGLSLRKHRGGSTHPFISEIRTRRPLAVPKNLTLRLRSRTRLKCGVLAVHAAGRTAAHKKLNRLATATGATTKNGPGLKRARKYGAAIANLAPTESEMSNSPRRF
jgi:hypothetical protein